MVSFIFFSIRRDFLVHKLRYSKTIKGDVSAALLGMFIGLIIGYLSLASLGGSAIDMSDITTLFYFIIIICLTLSIPTLHINFTLFVRILNIYLKIY